jgi:hypothetical protein
MRSKVLVPVVIAVAAGVIAVARVLGGVGEAPPSCTDPVPWQEAAVQEGRGAAVAGPVADATYAPDVGGEPTFLNLGNPHPDPDRFDVVIYADAREGFSEPPEDRFPGSMICVVGDVRVREGVPQIVVDSHLSVVVLDEDG